MVSGGWRFYSPHFDYIIGIGKTTLVCKVCAILQERYGVHVQGFYTQEIRGGGGGAKGERSCGPRTGFDVVTFDGRSGPLARVER